MTIIISKNGKNAKKVDKVGFEQEDYLQKYIYDNPESVPLYDIKEDIHLLILSREFPTTSGPVDALGIDEDGEIYLIETKLYKNPDKRLVVAQVLDYGASLWNSYGDVDEFLQIIGNEINEKFKIPLFLRIKEFFGMVDDQEVQTLLENMKRNLSSGNFRFVVLMDKLHSQLKDLIVFINQNSQFDIFAVEMEYYKYEDYEIMIPKLFGAEVKKNVSASSAGMRRKWNENSFFEDARSKLTEEQISAVQKVYDFSKNVADEISWGTGAAKGSFNPIFSKICPRSLYSVYSNGRLNFNFLWLDDNADMEKYRDEFKDNLTKIRGIVIPTDYKQKSIGIPIDKWSSVVDEFIKVVKDLIGHE